MMMTSHCPRGSSCEAHRNYIQQAEEEIEMGTKVILVVAMIELFGRALSPESSTRFEIYCTVPPLFDDNIAPRSFRQTRTPCRLFSFFLRVPLRVITRRSGARPP